MYQSHLVEVLLLTLLVVDFVCLSSVGTCVKRGFLVICEKVFKIRLVWLGLTTANCDCKCLVCTPSKETFSWAFLLCSREKNGPVARLVLD